MTHVLTLETIKNLTHDTYVLRLPKPEGLTFRPGQATMLSVMKDGWTDEGRPFTFTSQPEDSFLEFVIKAYPSHDGVTDQISRLAPGEKLKMGEIWGAIEDKGEGIFIAGGAGITPFIPILRRRAKSGDLKSSTLVFGAKMERDLILRDEWDAMADLDKRYILAEEKVLHLEQGQIDLGVLNTYVRGQGEGSHPFYICGPDPMIDSVRENLLALKVSRERIVTVSSPT